MKTEDKNPSRLHREYNCKNCDLCRTIRSEMEEAARDDAAVLNSITELLGSDYDRNKDQSATGTISLPDVGSFIIVGEVIPLKFFASWMVKNVPSKVHQEMLSVVCTACEKTFREYLVAGNIGCDGCDRSFSPFIKAVLQLMKNKQDEQ